MIRFEICRLGAAVVAVVAGWAAPARADDLDIGPDAAASALFEEGRSLIDAGEWQAGCDKLAQSMERYAAASTILNLARCAEHFGQVATAWARYKRGLVLNRDTPRGARREALEKIAQEGVTALEPRLPRLKVEVRAAGGGEAPAGLRVVESGRPLAVGTAVVLDPGPRTVVVTAPGFRPAERVVQLVEGETALAEIVLAPAPKPPPPSPPTPPAPTPDVPPAVPADASGAPWWAWVSGGAGLALTGLAVGFAADAASVASSLEERCGEDLVCDEDPSFDPEPDNDRKSRDIALSIGFGAGGVALLGVAVVGFVMGASAPQSGRVAPKVWADPREGSAGVTWGATF